MVIDTPPLTERLLGYLVDPRPPLTIGELAGALATDPLDCGRAILELYDDGRLAVVPLSGLRFELDPINVGTTDR